MALDFWKPLAQHHDLWRIVLRYAIDPTNVLQIACKKGDVHLLQWLRRYRVATATTSVQITL